jgi:hypothetical protein
MNCIKVEKLLPLYAGHDLSGRRERLIAAHLRSCTACSVAAAEYREAREIILRFTPPAFSSELYADIRKSVWQQIETESRVPTFFETIAAWFQPRFVWTAAAALLVILSVVGAYFSARRFTGRPEAIANIPGTVQQPQNKLGETVAGFSNANKRTTESHQVNIPARQRKPGRMVVPDQAGSVAAYSPDAQVTKIESSSPIIGTENLDLGSGTSAGTLRMEIQTRDPNIRIIWFTQRD